jgi:hypothetical protein
LTDLFRVRSNPCNEIALGEAFSRRRSIMRKNWRFTLALLAAIALGVGPAFAQTFNSGSTGADGAFNPTTNTTLALSPDGVFSFTTVNIPAGVTVTFTRNAANTPVTLLASGNVTIAGAINLNGAAGGNGSGGTAVGPNGGIGGPGGFNGGDGADAIASTTGGAGLGPGGGAGGIVYTDQPTGLNSSSGGGGGSFGTAGAPSGRRPEVTSGGGGGAARFGFTGGGGAGGGGAIVIASSGTITFNGGITATSGNASTAFDPGAGAGAGGSGGAIRLVANTITGSGGSINVAGGSGTPGNVSILTAAGAGGSGRIRIEAYTNTATINFAQAPSIGQPGVVALPNAPSLTITAVAGVAAPAAPTGSLSNPDILVPAGTANPMTIGLAAANIPLGTTVTVTAKPQNGAASSAVSSGLAGTLAASTATASLTIPTNQPSVLSASATFTLAALPGAGPLYADGEEVEQVRVAAILGGPSQVTYLTASGRELPASTLTETP